MTEQPPATDTPNTALSVHSHRVGVFVDRASHQWVVRDSNGQFWVLPEGDDPWGRRQPFQPVDDASLKPVPGHYKYFLGVPI